MFQARITHDGRWRVVLTREGVTLDICGAANSTVAWAQCDILNRMRGYV